MEVLHFIYDGYAGKLTGGYARYTAEFQSWTEDPGITRCICSDGKERLIPSFALEGFDYSTNQEPDYDGLFMVFGALCRS